MPTEEDQATAIDNMHKKFDEDQTCGSEDMVADSQTYIQTDMLITIVCSSIGGRVIIIRCLHRRKTRFCITSYACFSSA